MSDLPEGWVETEFGLLPKAWEPVEAQQFCEKVADGTHDSPKQQESGKLLITSKNIKDSRLDVASAYHISTDDFDEVNKRSKVNQWDVLLSMIGTVGEVCLIDKEPDFAIKNVGLFKCGDETKGKWLYYFLKSKSGQHYIYSRLSGTTQKYITLGELRKFPIPNPSLPEQKAIADMLSSFDEKIELLREQNKTLETLAQTIFKEWFVDFNYPDATGEMVGSELGEIPKGWGIGKVSDLGKVVCGKTPSKSKKVYFDGDVPFIKIPDMHNNMFIIETTDTLSQEGKATQALKTIPKGSVSVSCIATVGLVSISVKESQTNQQINTIIPEEEFMREFIFLDMQKRKKYLMDIGSGGTATLNVNTGTFSNIEIMIPCDDVLKEFSTTVFPTFEKILENCLQIQTLFKTRDTILPKLMSGLVKVST